MRYVNDTFFDSLDSTLGAVYFEKIHTYDNKTVKFQFWDTAGQEKYKSIARIYYKDAKVAIIVYDITRKESFDAMKNWIEELRQNGPKDIST